MGTQAVDAVDKLPLGNVTQLIEADIPAAERKGLAERLPLTELGGGTAELARHNGRRDPAPEPVDAGHIEIFIAAHHAAGGAKLGQQAVLRHQVAGQPHTVVAAPVAHLPDKAVAKQPRRGAVILPAEGAVLIGGQIKRAELVFRVIAPLGKKCLIKHRRPGDQPVGILRLIGEKALEPCAEILPEAGVIPLMRAAEKRRHSIGVQRVDVVAVNCHKHRRISGSGGVDTADAAAAQPVYPERALWQGERLVQHGKIQPLLLIRLAHFRHFAVRKAARPAVFVIRPALHALVFALFKTGGDCIHPLFAHIRRGQSAAGVHEIAADPRLFHAADLKTQLVGFQLVVPAPERERTELRHFGVDPRRKLRFVHSRPPYPAKKCASTAEQSA